MSFINSLFYGKYGEGIRYLFIGGLNVIITWATYAILVVIGIGPSFSNAISWIIGVLVAFILNKVFVFNSKTREKKEVSREVASFPLGRVFTGAVNILGFALLYNMGVDEELFGIDGFFAKIIISAIEITLNYIISKYLVFINNEEKSSD